MLQQVDSAAAVAVAGAAGTAEGDAAGSSNVDSSNSNSSKLKKPLKQLMTGMHQILLSDAVLSDATHAIFGPQQQQREFYLETRTATTASPQF